jgi:uncharacterized protein
MLSGVADSNTVIGLAKGGVFGLLAQVFAPLYVPPAVMYEVVVQGHGRPGAAELAQAAGRWVTEDPVDPPMLQQLPTTLDPADREVLAVAKRRAVDHVLTEDHQLRQQATRHGLTCLLASEVVVLFKREGLIPAARPVLDQMRAQGFGIDPLAYQQALQAAGE